MSGRSRKSSRVSSITRSYIRVVTSPRYPSSSPEIVMTAISQKGGKVSERRSLISPS